MSSVGNVLFMHCVNGDISAVKEIVSNGADVNWNDDNGMTTLQIAAAMGRVEIVKFLLNHSAIIDKPNNIGWTPLMHAARNGHSTTVEVLIYKGARVDLTNGLGTDVMSLAVASGDYLTVQHIRKSLPVEYHSKFSAPLVVAGMIGNDQLVRMLLESHHPNASLPCTGMTALMMATLKANKEVVELLLSYRSDVTQQNILGHSALDIANAMSHQHLQLILESYIQLNKRRQDTLPTLAATVRDIHRAMVTDSNGTHGRIPSMKIHNPRQDLYVKTQLQNSLNISHSETRNSTSACPTSFAESSINLNHIIEGMGFSSSPFNSNVTTIREHKTDLSSMSCHQLHQSNTSNNNLCISTGSCSPRSSCSTNSYSTNEKPPIIKNNLFKSSILNLSDAHISQQHSPGGKLHSSPKVLIPKEKSSTDHIHNSNNLLLSPQFHTCSCHTSSMTDNHFNSQYNIPRNPINISTNIIPCPCSTSTSGGQSNYSDLYSTKLISASENCYSPLQCSNSSGQIQNSADSILSPKLFGFSDQINSSRLTYSSPQSNAFSGQIHADNACRKSTPISNGVISSSSNDQLCIDRDGNFHSEYNICNGRVCNSANTFSSLQSDVSSNERFDFDEILSTDNTILLNQGHDSIDEIFQQQTSRNNIHSATDAYHQHNAVSNSVHNSCARFVSPQHSSRNDSIYNDQIFNDRDSNIQSECKACSDDVCNSTNTFSSLQSDMINNKSFDFNETLSTDNTILLNQVHDSIEEILQQQTSRNDIHSGTDAYHQHNVVGNSIHNSCARFVTPRNDPIHNSADSLLYQPRAINQQIDQLNQIHPNIKHFSSSLNDSLASRVTRAKFQNNNKDIHVNHLNRNTQSRNTEFHLPNNHLSPHRLNQNAVPCCKNQSSTVHEQFCNSEMYARVPLSCLNQNCACDVSRGKCRLRSDCLPLTAQTSSPRSLKRTIHQITVESSSPKSIKRESHETSQSSPINFIRVMIESQTPESSYQHHMNGNNQYSSPSRTVTFNEISSPSDRIHTVEIELPLLNKDQMCSPSELSPKIRIKLNPETEPFQKTPNF